jgi:uncharacterized UPF0160 family protein
MDFFKKKITVVAHSGDFHADDVFACAALWLWAEKIGNRLEIIRTREPDIIKKADIVVDVGGICDPEKNKFDHHQNGGAGKRANGVPYASFGLIWKKYGEIVCGNKDIADRIDKNLVMPIDARDNGVNISKANELNIVDYRTSDMICNFNITWQEDKKMKQKQFEKVLNFSKEILKREIAWARALLAGEKETNRAIKEQNEPEILILEKETEWHEAVSRNKRIKFVVYPRIDKSWSIQVGRDDLEDYDSDRIKFPKDWWGLRNEDLVKISGIGDASYCADKGWFAVAKTKEGAIEMAKMALQNGLN